MYRRAGLLIGHAPRDGTGAGAEVDDDRPRVRSDETAGLVNRGTSHQLGLGAGDEHARSDGEHRVPEVRHAGEVLERLASHPTCDELLERTLEAGADIGMTPQIRPLDGQEVGGQRLGVVTRATAPLQQPAVEQLRRAQVAAPGSSALRLGKPVRGIRIGERLDHRIEVPVEHVVEVV